ncbi:MAG: NAD(P)-dependent oxidoreductase, partial [Bauldia litoralis]
MTIAATLPNKPPAPRRMEALATLPVFFRLAGRKVIVAGGSEAAAWKAELLAATGAEVHVYADDLDPAFEVLIAAGSLDGSLVHHARRWDQAILLGAAVAICDAATETEAKAFADAARAVGVSVNVIDKPAFCDFQFGSIVNRSPVVVAVSTDGAAPILGQAIRRRIETLLPPALAGWAELARAMRDRIAATLAAGPQRRAFWEHFVDRAFGSTPGEGAFDNLMIDASDIASGAHASQGRVTLVGAGPGDAELLTLKAVRTLQSADVILFD